ncbi:MAG: hypothetical protein ACI9LY_001600 [Arenicella sp.]|jgi:hypothetical protein
MQMNSVLKIVVLLVTVLFMIGCQSAVKKDYARLPTPPRKVVEQPAVRLPGEDNTPEIAAYAPLEPGIMAFSDRLYFMLDSDLEWQIGETSKRIVVPLGFVSDGASVPKVFWPLGLVPYGVHGRATVVHDYMYWFQQCSRKQTDNIMLIALKESGVSFIKRFILTVGVKWFGGFAWRENARDRQNHFSRLIARETAAKSAGWFAEWTPRYPYPKGSPAEPFQAPIPFTWKEYEAFLKTEGARDPVLSAPDYCHCGDSMKVPQGDDELCQ